MLLNLRHLCYELEMKKILCKVISHASFADWINQGGCLNFYIFKMVSGREEILIYSNGFVLHKIGAVT